MPPVGATNEPTPDALEVELIPISEWTSGEKATMFEALKPEGGAARAIAQILASDEPLTQAGIGRLLGRTQGRVSQLLKTRAKSFVTFISFHIEEEEEIPYAKTNKRFYPRKSFTDCVEAYLTEFGLRRAELEYIKQLKRDIDYATAPQMREWGSDTPAQDANLMNDHLFDVSTPDELRAESEQAVWIENWLNNKRVELHNAAKHGHSWEKPDLGAALQSKIGEPFSQATGRKLTGKTTRAYDKDLYREGCYRQEHNTHDYVTAEPETDPNDPKGSYRFDKKSGGKPIAAFLPQHTEDGITERRINLRSKVGREEFREHLAKSTEPTKILRQGVSTLERLDSLPDAKRGELFDKIFKKREPKAASDVSDPKPPKPTYSQVTTSRGKRQFVRLGVRLPDTVTGPELLATLRAYRKPEQVEQPSFSFPPIPSIAVQDREWELAMHRVGIAQNSTPRYLQASFKAPFEGGRHERAYIQEVEGS